MLVELSVVEQRYQAVMEVLQDGLKVTEVAERYGVSRQIVHRWIRRYEQSGPQRPCRSQSPTQIVRPPDLIRGRGRYLRAAPAAPGLGALHAPGQTRQARGGASAVSLEHLSRPRAEQPNRT